MTAAVRSRRCQWTLAGTVEASLESEWVFPRVAAAELLNHEKPELLGSDKGGEDRDRACRRSWR